MIPSVLDSQTNGFITKWTVSGDATDRTIALPLVNTRSEGALSYNCTVDWGDGSALSTVTAYNDVNRIHTYATNGTYNVEIRGTCEGWSFNNGGDRLKIVQVVYWGDAGGFNGVKYLKSGFYGCSNLTSLGTGVILPSGAGIGLDGFSNAFYGCSQLTSIPTDLFRYNTTVTTNGFRNTFRNCTALTFIPIDLFRYNTTVTTNGFNSTFYNCMKLTSIPTDLFKYNINLTSDGFNSTFYNCSLLVSIPIDLFRYNVSISSSGFYYTFFSCLSLTSIPTDIFKYNTAVSSDGFNGTFYGCTNLATVPAQLFKYNTQCTNFNEVFYNCVRLQLIENLFFDAGDEGSRFLNLSVDFTNSFNRSLFFGIQGSAPDLWSCNFGSGTPTKTGCFGGAGNSLTSLANYGTVPADWK